MFIRAFDFLRNLLGYPKKLYTSMLNNKTLLISQNNLINQGTMINQMYLLDLKLLSLPLQKNRKKLF